LPGVRFPSSLFAEQFKEAKSKRELLDFGQR